MPGTERPFISVYGGSLATHLAGAGVFVLLGLPRRLWGARRSVLSPATGFALWASWLIGFALVTTGRGAFLTLGIPLALLTILRPSWRLIAPVILLLLAATLFSLTGSGITPPGTDRQLRSVSTEQFIERAKSIVGVSDRWELTNTTGWRVEWWKDILAYTFKGPFFWQGKGFGVNLASEDGYQVYADESLRSPHNSHLTILARMGVPGWVLWWVFSLGFLGSLIRGRSRALRTHDPLRADILLWILLYWLAFMVNATFTVAFESPQYGIPFWILVGLALAILSQPSFHREGEPRAKDA